METMNAEVFHVDASSEIAEAKPNSILSEALLQNPDVKVIRFHFAKGQELSEHTATMAAMICQVSGRAKWGLGDEQREAVPGDWAYMPPNLKHSIHAIEESIVLLLLLKKTGATT